MEMSGVEGPGVGCAEGGCATLFFRFASSSSSCLMRAKNSSLAPVAGEAAATVAAAELDSRGAECAALACAEAIAVAEAVAERAVCGRLGGDALELELEWEA